MNLAVAVCSPTILSLLGGELAMLTQLKAHVFRTRQAILISIGRGGACEVQACVRTRLPTQRTHTELLLR